MEKMVTEEEEEEPAAATGEGVSVKSVSPVQSSEDGGVQKKRHNSD